MFLLLELFLLNLLLYILLSEYFHLFSNFRIYLLNMLLNDVVCFLNRLFFFASVCSYEKTLHNLIEIFIWVILMRFFIENFFLTFTFLKIFFMLFLRHTFKIKISCYILKSIKCFTRRIKELILR